MPYAVFEKALTPQGDALCQLVVCATTPGALKTNAGFSIVVDRGLDALAGMDMVIVPGWDVPEHAPEPELLTALQNAHAAGSPHCWVVYGHVRGGRRRPAGKPSGNDALAMGGGLSASLSFSADG